MMKIFVIASVVTIIASIVFTSMFKPELPNYSTGAGVWKNAITDSEDNTYSFRREITISNPTEWNQTGTYAVKQQMYVDSITSRKSFKCPYGEHKVVKINETANETGAEIMVDIPSFAVYANSSYLLIYFDYEVAAESDQTYYLYYKSDESIDLTSLENADVGLFSLGGFVTNYSVGHLTLASGFIHNVAPFREMGLNVEYENYIFDEDFWTPSIETNDNPWPPIPEFRFQSAAMSILGGEVGLRTNTSFSVYNTSIRVVAGKYASEREFMGFYDGSLDATQNTSQPFVGISIRQPSEYYSEWEDQTQFVSDIRFHYANFTYSDIIPNHYVGGEYQKNIFEDVNYIEVEFVYEFLIDEIGNTTFYLREHGWGESTLFTVNLGVLPWDTAYFQISGEENNFNVKSLMIAENNPLEEKQANGVSISVGYEEALGYYKTLPTELSYTFVLGIVTLAVMAFYIIAILFSKVRSIRALSEMLISLYSYVMIIVSIVLLIKYHPARELLSLNDGYWVTGDSYLGLYVYSTAATEPLLFYILVLTVPISLFLFIQGAMKNLKKKHPEAEKGINGSNVGITIAILIFLFISLGQLFSGDLEKLKTVTFTMLSLTMIFILMFQMKDGWSDGKDAAKKGKGKGLKKFVSYLAFLYFGLKIVIEAYKLILADDPFAAIMDSGTSPTESLGQLTPLLLSWGIPSNWVEIIAFVFSNYLTFIIIGFTFLKESFGEDGNWAYKFNAGLWAVNLYFMMDQIVLPFYTLVLSLIYISMWFTANLMTRYNVSMGNLLNTDE